MEFAEELWLLLIISYYMKGHEKEFGSCQGSLVVGILQTSRKWTQTTEQETAPEGINHNSSCNSCD